MADDPANGGGEEGERDPRSGRFRPGRSGNPAGRPKGSRTRAAVMLDMLAEGEAQRIVDAVIRQAQRGDTAAALILARVWPVPKGRKVRLRLPRLDGAAPAAAGLAEVVERVAAGDLAPEEGQAVARLLEGYLNAVAVADLESRLGALEARQGQPGP